MSSNIITRNNNFIILILFRITENDKKLLRADESDNQWSSGREIRRLQKPRVRKNVQEESVHYIRERRQQQTKEERVWEFSLHARGKAL